MRRVGFTLIEVLLVLVIIGVVTAVTIPQFVRSMRGNRLRTAARTVIAAGRYSRSMAVLHQRAIALRFAVGGSQLLIDVNRPVPATNTTEEVLLPSLRDDRLGAAPEESATTASGPGMNIRLERKLDLVKIVEVEQQQADLAKDDEATVVYQSNGRCTPYRVRIEDENGDAIEITVDALGSPELVRKKVL